MPYAYLTEEMEARIAEVVRGKLVWDLGAGDFVLSERLLALGARAVMAVEKEVRRDPPKRVQLLRGRFDEVGFPTQIDVAFVSWPSNWRMPGLVNFLEAAEIVIYIGSNTNGNACGPSDMWRHLLGREILTYIPRWGNSMIIYGKGERNGPLLGEEYAALFPEDILSVEEAEELAAKYKGGGFHARSP